MTSSFENAPHTIDHGKVVDHEQFIDKAKRIVVETFNIEVPGTPLVIDDVYIVWFAKVLGNWKALISTDVVSGIYFEVTYNGAKEETYLDIYGKVSNHVIADVLSNVHFL